MNNANKIVVGARLFNRGDFANVSKYGTVISVPEDGYINVRYDDGSVSVYQPVALFAVGRFKLVG